MKHQLPTIHSSLTEEDWQDLRRSRFTASEIHKLMGTPKTKSEFLSETAKSFVFEKAAEYLTGNRTEIYGRALDWGKEHEKEAFHTSSNKPMTFIPTTERRPTPSSLMVFGVVTLPMHLVTSSLKSNVLLIQATTCKTSSSKTTSNSSPNGRSIIGRCRWE
jgi:hypothetical protein